ncbi:MAG: tRNA (N(6)-L-threonylcarbamoyladenosine(37)-C(2))-methylthiotransferase MtaB [Candidatus Marinimicrobia bacterium]|nr:tRNA (N(6)-L-threonylcarbamoyladenosine(37)-C(2))-methylthiotransferase MtaB [Candidatus Neomarinimicrobiota bacterium]|tara:strand:- start:59710 stop:60996 length:1287 start_codon:yes stop_codon:yes gene_type:complete
MSSPYLKFAYHTFGCKVNFADSCLISRELIKEGLSQVNIKDQADIYILNTCSVTENADKKAQKFIKKLHLKYPQSKIIVTGCYAQLKPKEISEIKGVSKVIGLNDKFNFKEYYNLINDDSITRKLNTNKFQISYSLSERVRAFIKIQDGCDYICSYCTIPRARGKSRSGKINEIINVIKELVNNGTKEIIMSGINIGDFGKGNNENLLDLLKAIELIEGLQRYRISSIEPNLLNDDIIYFLSKSKKALPHLHIPLQSGSDKVLKNMRRRYSVSYYKKLINKLNKIIPNVCIGVDVIVGYPIEEEKNFLETYSLVSELDISYLHVFSYSDRSNTYANGLVNKVSDEDKKYRRKLLQQLSRSKFSSYINKNLNSSKRVLFENYNNGILDGLTENYIRVYSRGDKTLINQIKEVNLIKYKNNDVNGELIVR